jgi:hypothetical protein
MTTASTAPFRERTGAWRETLGPWGLVACPILQRSNRVITLSAEIPGQGVVTRHITFNVLRPVTTIVTSTIEPVTTAITADGRERVMWTENLQPGISFSASNFPVQQFSGKLQWVQIINSEWGERTVESTGQRYRLDQPEGALDKDYPYMSGAGTGDQPGSIFPIHEFSRYEFHDDFTMYLMYQHDSSSVWVPLRAVTWYVWAAAREANPSDGADDWSIEDYGHSDNPQDEDWDQPVTWDTVIDGSNDDWKPIE